MGQRWKHAPPGSHWGEFGPDDQRGRMNLVDARKVREGIAEAREGIVFCLSLPLDVPGGRAVNPRRSPPRRFAVVRDGASAGEQAFCWPSCHDDPELTDVTCDDAVLLTLQYSTQWDSFAHIGSLFDADGDGVPERVFYNGFRAGVDIHPAVEDREAEAWARYPDPRADALAIDGLAQHGAQGRGVLIDLEHHFGRTRRAIDFADLEGVMKADGVTVERGDMVCLHTGYADTLLGMHKVPDIERLRASELGLDGRDPRLLEWVVDSGLACLAADNTAVEAVQPKLPLAAATPRPRMPLHEHCLFKNGIHLGELWYLTELARWLRAHGRSRFLLTAPPLRLPGAVGSPVTPIATV